MTTLTTEAYTVCELGHSHWGTAGAAGLFLVSEDGASVLLQHRSPEVHEGDCWGLPGGARNWGENALEAACREAEEELECSLPPTSLLGEVVANHGGWAYTTVVASVRPFPLPASYGWETGEEGFRWVPLFEVAALPLHSGLRAALPKLLACVK